MARKVTLKQASVIGNRLNLDWQQVDLKEFHMGLNVELEHTDVTKGDLIITAKIALAHLDELPDYYTRLKKMES